MRSVKGAPDRGWPDHHSERTRTRRGLHPFKPLPTFLGVVISLGLFLILARPADAQSQATPPAAVQPAQAPVVQPAPPATQPVPPPPAQPAQTPAPQPAQAPAEQPPAPPAPAPPKPAKERLITLDFNNVDLPVFVKFVSEIIGKNFIIDERVRGKVTIFSPTKISVDKVYQVFQSVLEIKGLAAVPAGEMIQILPASDVPPERDINVYYLENANAEETAKLLVSLTTRAAMPAAAGRPVVRTGDFEGPVQIIPDKATNALLITASKNDFEMLKQVILKLDVRRRQVFVEAVIMEVGQDRLRELGTTLTAAGGYQTSNQKLTVLGGFNATPSDFSGIADIPGLNIGISTVNVQALLTALQSTADTNILSTPQILTTNNQKAKIVVGQNVPFVTSTSQTPGAVTQRQIQRQDVGVTLEITPEILEGDRVRMDIRQEISTLADTPQAVLLDLGPTTNKREATTTVIVSNRQTVVIGGLIRDDLTKSEKKIPLLGDIPLIGWLFKFQSKRVVKTNLLIFLTPHVVRENQDMDALRLQKSEELRRVMTDEAVEYLKRREEFLNSINPPQDKR